MVKKLATFIALITINIGFTLDLNQLSDYLFVDGKNHFNLDGYYSQIGSQEFKDGVPGTKLRYSDRGGAGFVGFYANKDNAIFAQAGYNQMRIDWNENPRFNKKNFNDLIISLAYITHSIPNWRWVLRAAAHVDTEFYDFSSHTFYTGILWGRLQYNKTTGVHIGLLGQGGVKSHYVLPILGFDWILFRRWQLNAIFPLEASFGYYITPYWSIKAKYRSFGGWYRSQHRVGQDEPVPNTLFQVYSSGADLGIYYSRMNLDFSVAGGYNIGGWIFMQNLNKTDEEYFHFRGAPYGRATVSFAF